MPGTVCSTSAEQVLTKTRSPSWNPLVHVFSMFIVLDVACRFPSRLEIFHRRVGRAGAGSVQRDDFAWRGRRKGDAENQPGRYDQSGDSAVQRHGRIASLGIDREVEERRRDGDDRNRLRRAALLAARPAPRVTVA